MININIQSFIVSFLLVITIVLNILENESKSTERDCNSFIENGDSYHERYENALALREYEMAYQMCPDNFEALVKLTRAYDDCGEDLKGIKPDENRPIEAEKYFQGAVKYSEILLQKFPEKLETYFLSALSYGNLSRYKEGKEKVELARYIEEYAKRAIEVDPNFAPAYVVLGIYYREVASLNGLKKALANGFMGGLPTGTFEESVEALNKALQLSPQGPYVHFDLARTYEEINNLDKAIEHYKQVVELPVVDHDDNRKKKIAEERLKVLKSSQNNITTKVSSD
ncbi:MAG: tetratricopeptide repeat protein [Thermodesulfobacteriota bacterium]